MTLSIGTVPLEGCVSWKVVNIMDIHVDNNFKIRSVNGYNYVCKNSLIIDEIRSLLH